MNKKYVWAFIALITAYITLALTLPTDPAVLEKHSITQGQARLLNLTILLPLTAIYLAAFYGFLRFKAYADSVHDTKEGIALSALSRGLMVLAFSLPINSIMNSSVNYIKLDHGNLLAPATIIENYLSLLLPFIAFVLIARGAHELINTLKDKKIASATPTMGLLAPILMASIFTWLIVSNYHHETSVHVYFMPVWIVVLTLAVPYVYLWCTAITAARKLFLYKDQVKGIIYRRAIDYLAKGILTIISVSILIQFIATISSQFNRLNLTPLLIIVYILIGLYALGYGLVARGAKRLKQIEEV